MAGIIEYDFLNCRGSAGMEHFATPDQFSSISIVYALKWLLHTTAAGAGIDRY